MAVNGNIFTMEDSNTETFTALCGQLAGLIRSASSDFENLCASSLIKPCAKYKPEDYNVLANLTEAQRKENHYGFGKEAKVIAKSTTSVPKNTYTYIHPKGGESSPNRMRDWDGYYHGAILPINFIFPSKLYVDWVNGIELRVNQVDTTKNVTLANVMNAGDDMYLALFVYRDSSRQWLFPTNFRVKDLTASYFPTILIAQNETQISQSGAQPTSYIYPYVLSDLAANNTYTMIAVGVKNTTYQNSKLPLSPSSYGDMYSTDIDNNDGGNHDRKAYTAETAKTIIGLTGSFSVTAGKFVKSGSNYYPSGTIGKLTLTTPSNWLWTSMDRVNVRVEVHNGTGNMYSSSGSLITQPLKIYDSPTTLDKASTTFSIDNVFATLGNYLFQDSTNGVGSMYIIVNVYVTNPNNTTQVIHLINNQTYTIPRA